MSAPQPPPRRAKTDEAVAAEAEGDGDAAAAKPKVPPRRRPAPAPPSAGAGGAGAGSGAAAAAAATEEDDDDKDGGTGYKAPPKTATLQEIMNREEEDESLARYKATLLAGAKSAAASSDPRHVIVEDFSVLVDGREPIVMKLSTPEEQAAATATRFVFKEGETYQTRIRFRIQHDVVLGLKITNSVFKLGMRVDRTRTMVGSYGPHADAYAWTSPRQAWPKGMMARGSYSATIQITDDDDNKHLELKYKFDLKKKWPKK